MIKTRALDYWTTFLIMMPISGALFATFRLLSNLIANLLFGWDYSWTEDLVAGAAFGLLFGAMTAFLMRKSQVPITFEGSADTFQRVTAKTLSELGYQVVFKDSLLVAHKPPSRKANLVIFEIHLQIEEGQAILEGPWTTLRKLEPTIKTIASVVKEVQSEM